jgi:hypothetical protein
MAVGSGSVRNRWYQVHRVHVRSRPARHTHHRVPWRLLLLELAPLRRAERTVRRAAAKIVAARGGVRKESAE